MRVCTQGTYDHTSIAGARRSQGRGLSDGAEVEVTPTRAAKPPDRMPRAATATAYVSVPGPSSDEVRVPVATITGARDGPTVLMVAGVHPCEFTGIEAARRLVRTVDPATLVGTLIIVPCLNLPGFYALSAHVNPLDGLDAGRAFPGDPAGSHTERLVHLVWERLARRADYIFDLHGGDLEEELVEHSLIALTGRRDVDERAEALARALNMPIFVRMPARPGPPPARGGLRVLAGAAGIPAVLTETGGHGVLREDEVLFLVRCLEDGLRHLAMLPGKPSGAVAPTVLNRFEGVYAPADGLWSPAVGKGAAVRAGQVLGEIRGLFGEPLCEITADEDAVVLVVATSPPRRAGDILFGLGMVE
jgi:predicted deacylase